MKPSKHLKGFRLETCSTVTHCYRGVKDPLHNGCQTRSPQRTFLRLGQYIGRQYIPLRSNPHDRAEIAEALSASPPTHKSIKVKKISVVMPLVKRSKRYNPPAIHVMVFILAIPGYKA
ncbi:hypothetical protein TNCV_165111 [Trichonephila clavipes]|nr:hypothetical protein TNCV_165111 [Trichonephila clavipes]